ncbi:hypothetical protein GW17_00039536 [Ensete ventricosum]|nr:hypothetical protein GW17_00039536 [Ensete ventricosum]
MHMMMVYVLVFQVDFRILKAVAIEHANDVDTAAESILLEVLPSIAGSCEASCTLQDKDAMKHPSSAGQIAFGLWLNVLALETISYFYSCDVNVHWRSRSQRHRESENVINDLHDSAEIDSSAVASVVGCDVPNAPVEPFERNSDDLGNKMITKDGSFSIHGSEEQSGWSFQPAIAQCLYELEANNTVSVSAGAISGDDFKDFGEAAGSWGCGINQVTTTTAECEELHSDLVDESIADLSFERGILSANDDNLSATLLTRSGQFVNIDYLEDLISDAKSNKKKMLSAMELITERMKELEHLKERNKKAQEESSCAGLDTLTKVEELKKILKDTKEANDMHAGEVYGEKAILATEARELQSRLHSLSDERDKSLSLIDEVQ